MQHGAADEPFLWLVCQDLRADRSVKPVDAPDEGDHEPVADAQRISSWTGSPSRAAVTLRSVRSALATLPLRPMTLPMSSSATWSSITVAPSSSTTSTVTAPGSSTSDFATYSTRSLAAIVATLLGRGHDARVPEQAKDGVRRLGALREPGLRLVGIDLERDRIGPRVVVAKRLDRSTVACASAVGDDDPVGRLLRRADAREPDTDCHGYSFFLGLRDAGHARLT